MVNGGSGVPTEVLIEELTVLEMQDIKQLPTPSPPSCRKQELYTDTNVFKDLDNHVINVRDLFVLSLFARLYALSIISISLGHTVINFNSWQDLWLQKHG